MDEIIYKTIKSALDEQFAKLKSDQEFYAQEEEKPFDFLDNGRRKQEIDNCMAAIAYIKTLRGAN